MKKYSIFDRIIDICGVVILIIMWYHTFSNYNYLPSSIPTHYNWFGEVDGLGQKQIISIMPIFASVLFVGFSLINHFLSGNKPSILKFNSIQIFWCNRLISLLKLIFVLIIGLIHYKTIQIAFGKCDSLGSWFVSVSFSIIMLVLIYFLNKIIKTNSNKL